VKEIYFEARPARETIMIIEGVYLVGPKRLTLSEEIKVLTRPRPTLDERKARWIAHIAISSV
jgi:hypothetical protein